MSPIYDPKTYEPTQSLGRTISRVKLAMMEALDHELEPFDISAAQYVILVTLAAGEADSASALCKGISYDPGAMTRMIDRLEQKGLIRRVQRPDDRRKVLLELTPEGKTLYPQMRASALVSDACGASPCMSAQAATSAAATTSDNHSIRDFIARSTVRTALGPAPQGITVRCRTPPAHPRWQASASAGRRACGRPLL